MAQAKTLKRRIGIGVAITLGAALILFAIQNAATVELRFGPLTFTTRRFILIAISFSTGFVIATLLWWAKSWRSSAG